MHDHPSKQKRLLLAATSELTLRSFLLPYAEHFRDRGWVVDGMASGVASCDPCVLTFDHVWNASWGRSVFRLANLKAVREVRAAALRGRYDIIHVHTPVAGLVVRLAARLIPRSRRPQIVYTAHGFHFHSGGQPARNAMFAGIEKIAGQWTDRLVVINRDDWSAALRYRLVRPTRLRFIPGIGIDMNDWRSASVSAGEVRAAQREIGLEEGEFLFLVVAELNPGKRHRDLIQAMEILGRDDVWLAFAGEGPAERDLRRMVTDLGVDRRTAFLGYRDDIRALMNASVAVVLPSEREGLPRSIMEAMALGVPVIATDIRGSRDLLEGGAGILVAVGDSVGLAAAMEMVMDDEKTRNRMAAEARSRIGDFALGTTVKLHEGLYRDLLGDDQ